MHYVHWYYRFQFCYTYATVNCFNPDIVCTYSIEYSYIYMAYILVAVIVMGYFCQVQLQCNGYITTPLDLVVGAHTDIIMDSLQGFL